MGKNYVQNEAGIWLPAKGGPDGETIVRGTGPDGEIDVKQVGSNVELYGATENDRPSADDVVIGAVYMAVDTQEIWQSNGTEWKVIN